MDYKKITVEIPTRWDTLAYKYLGNCFNTLPIIQANPSIPITAFIPKNTTVLIPVIEDTAASSQLPPWKQ